MNPATILEIYWSYGKFEGVEIERLSKILGRPVDLDKDGDVTYKDRNAELTLDEALSVGHSFEVKGYKPYIRPGDIDSFKPRHDAPAPVNNKCNVIVAGTSVMEINDVDVATDLCTDALQSRLNDGWRILAICVQPEPTTT